MILAGILDFLTWPLVIIVSYYLIKAVLKKYEKKLEEL
jgi:hypothetical protein